jgi:ornithine carbamoyltransferase
MSISDLTPSEFSALVRNAAARKHDVKSGRVPRLSNGLAGETVAMMFSKRSTRTRVSTEAAVTMLGGHPMFLGKDDIQLGVGTPCLANRSAWTTISLLNSRHRSMNLCMIPPLSSHQ